MTEVINFSLIGAPDISFGTGTFTVTLQDGQNVAIDQVNLDHVYPSLTEGSVLFKGSTAGGDQDNSNFFYDKTNTRLRIPELTGGISSAGSLSITSTDHATKGHVLLQPDGGNVSIGGSSPSELLHVQAVGAAGIRIENDSAGTAGDMTVKFAKNGTVGYILGVDDSDSDSFKIADSTSLESSTRVTIKSGDVGIGESTPLGKFHVKSADAGGGVSINPDGDEVVVEGSGNSGITIISGNTSNSALFFGDVDDGSAARLDYNHNTDAFKVFIGAAEILEITDSKMTLGNEANTQNTAGLVVSQGANNDEIVSLMSDNVAHGITGLNNTKTFGVLQQAAAGSGGMSLEGYSEATVGIQVDSFVTTETSTKSTAATASIYLNSALKSGTNVTSHGANVNMFALAEDGATRLIIDSEGDIHVDVNGDATTLTTYDGHDDVQLLESYKSLTAGPEFNKTLGPWVEDNLTVLKQGGVISEVDGSVMVSYKALNGLLIDAIRQLDSRLKSLGA